MPKRAGSCTRGRTGWNRWYKGRTRHVCGLGVVESEVEDRWIAIKAAIDAQEQSDKDGVRIEHPKPQGLALRDAISLFFTHLDHRVDHGKPKPLSKRMAYNYQKDVNAFGSSAGGSAMLLSIGPDHFAAFARRYAKHSASGYASVVAHVRAFFRWCVEMEHLDRVRFGGEFSAPTKGDVRDQRIAKPKRFAPADVRKLYDAANPTMRAMIGLGVAAAMTPAEIAGLERSCVNLDTGIIDFRRRKTGRVRRVVPLPDEIADDLRKYVRPTPSSPSDDGLFFVTVSGLPYCRMRPQIRSKMGTTPVNIITILFGRLCTDNGVAAVGGGLGFTGLRTTFVNLAPPGYREEVELLTGHAMGTVLLDHYLEDVGLDRLRCVVNHVWGQISTSPPDAASAADSPPPPA